MFDFAWIFHVKQDLSVDIAQNQQNTVLRLVEAYGIDKRKLSLRKKKKKIDWAQCLCLPVQSENTYTFASYQ